MANAMPDWQRALLSKPSISVRRGIAWGFNQAYEDTSTLVLTSTSSHYVDIRFSLKGDPTSGASFWAFAGTCETSVSGTLECTGHGKWAHPIDSQNSSAIDEGDIFLLQNGDCMEVGVMKNPATGEKQLYKEYWSSPYANRSPCVVGITTGKIEGMVIRVGEHCQGILQEKSSGKLFVERWTRSNDTVEGKWLKDGRSNTDTEQVEVILPCMWAAGGERSKGDVITAKGRRWEIIESGG